jgi:iron complex outermembrane receptor protein
LSANHGIVSPKVGALVHLTPQVGLYANASRGFRSTDGVISDPTLAPIVAWNYETGLKLDRDINGLPWSATATLFRMNVNNEQTFNPLTGQANNGGASRRQGLELQTQVPVTSAASIDADWTFLDARYKHLIAVSEDASEPPATLDGLRVYNTAQYVGTAALQIAPPRTWWSLRLAGNWVGPYSPFDGPGVVLGSYGLAHVSGTAQWRSVRLEVGMRNVFDRAYPELVAGHVVDPGQPRAVFTTLKTVF